MNAWSTSRNTAVRSTKTERIANAVVMPRCRAKPHGIQDRLVPVAVETYTNGEGFYEFDVVAVPYGSYTISVLIPQGRR